ncbi:MAG: ABC transporter ATP-binding protein [Gemmatimonadaceae bacterium]
MISFAGVSKRYRGFMGREVRALTELTLDLREGEVFGLAGPNGAGKSTLIALLLGFLGPTSGRVSIRGEDPRRFIQSNGVGYLSELINIPPAWRVEAALARYGILAGVPADKLSARVEEMIAKLGLTEHRTKRVRQLSKGNLQRLGLAQALLGDDTLIVLDEPTHGLDPVWTQRFRDVVTDLRRPDRTILIASHNLDELARLADRVGIIDHGALQRIVDVRATERDVTEGAPYRIAVSRGEEHVAAELPGARVIGRGEFEVSGLSLEQLNASVVRLIGAGVLVSAVYPVHSALEQQFREVVRAADGEP